MSAPAATPAPSPFDASAAFPSSSAASLAAASPPTAGEDAPSYQQNLLTRLLIGPPIHTNEQEESRLPKFLALPIFSSDAISSVAYATQEILLALGGAGLAAAAYSALYSGYLWSVTLAIIVLLSIVVFSYRQTIFAYPSGGGSYIVTKENLGVTPGLVAAAALLIDYVLTVSVSVASGAQNLLSIPFFHKLNWSPEVVCLVFIALLTLANLRGLKETGKIFALPPFLFMGLCYLMILLGLLGPSIGWQLHMDAVTSVVPPDYDGATRAATGVGGVGIFLALRAFANGCSAMTGTEAISNGVPAFQKPQAKNAATTLNLMALVLGSLFIGISALAAKFHVVYWHPVGSELPTAVIDQLSGTVFGRTGTWSLGYYAVQFATVSILVLAANTSFAGFPSLASILANDRYLPKELAHRGDRLVFGRGIILLGVCAALLIVLFQGSVDRLIPLYALGVFSAFTLSQMGMVQHWRKERGAGWQAKATVNGIGACATALVFSVILVEKLPEGAWIVVVVAGCLVYLFTSIHNRYVARQRGLSLSGAPVSGAGDSENEHALTPSTNGIGSGVGGNIVTMATPSATHKNGAHHPAARNLPAAPQRNTVLVLVPGIHKGIVPAINYARLIGRDIRPVYIEIDPEQTPAIRAEWNRYVPDIPLIVTPSPYRSLVQPLIAYIDKVTDEFDDDVVTLIIPESFSGNLLDTLLRSTAATQIKLALLGREDVVVTNVRYRLVD